MQIYSDVAPGDNMHAIIRRMLPVAKKAKDRVRMEYRVGDGAGIFVEVGPEETEVEAIARFEAERKANKEEYQNSPEGRRLATKKKRSDKAQDRKIDAILAKQLASFSIKDRATWDAYVVRRTENRYSGVYFRFVAEWASILEKKHAAGETLSHETVEAAKMEVDSDILDFMDNGYEMEARGAIIMYWQHGSLIESFYKSI